MTDLLPILVAVGSLAGSSIAILTFWMKFSDRITTANGTAERAEAVAQDAKKDAHETAQSLAIQTAAFSLYREQIAKEYIHREVMREVEDRLTAAINRLGDRFDKVLATKMVGH
jgi:DNA-binding protein H-NS